MAKEEPYDLMPHKDIIELKNQLKNLKSEKFSFHELMNSVNALTKSMDSMMKLFKEAGEEIRAEEKEDTLNKKLDGIIEQNKVIADGMVAVSDMVKDFIGKQKIPEPIQAQPTPSFQPPKPDIQQPQLPGLEPLPGEPSLKMDQLPPPPQDPVAMPSIPFSNLEEPQNPKKKGLFGRFKQ
jgi:hypothetical protein